MPYKQISAVKMNYKEAVKHPNPPVISEYSPIMKDTAELKMAREKEEFQLRANKKMNEVVSRFLEYKTKELELEGYSQEEIALAIYEIENPDDNYDEYLSDDEGYSSCSDDDQC